jgi:hypothetical protein
MPAKRIGGNRERHERSPLGHQPRAFDSLSRRMM